MTLLLELTALVGPRVLIDDSEKAYAEIDQSTNVTPSLPMLVVVVFTCEELIKVVQCCIKHQKPVVIRAAGTGKTGGAVANENSVLIDITRLNRILSISKKNMTVEVEPGVVLSDLQEEVHRLGLYYPPDPASARLCTLGGNVAENAAGPSTLKYGTTRDYLLGGQAIIGTGEVIDFGKRCPKGVAGYDVASLLCGSEGTLAVFTKLVLRLLPKPVSFSSAIFYFGDEEEALKAVTSVLGNGHLPKTLEYVDQVCLTALKKLSGLVTPDGVKAALIIECDASYQSGAEEQIHTIARMLKPYSFMEAHITTSDQEREEVWRIRSMLSEACSSWFGHKLSEDVAVPLGMLLEFSIAIKALARPPHVVCGLFGHAGDGNLHVQIMFDDISLKEIAQSVRHEVLLLVLRLGGTLAAEHGIGLQKKAYLGLEQSPSLIDLQRRIKKAFDPHNLLNPGKIFDV